jgi:OmpA-OmpF porin, OOP family
MYSYDFVRAVFVLAVEVQKNGLKSYAQASQSPKIPYTPRCYYTHLFHQGCLMKKTLLALTIAAAALASVNAHAFNAQRVHRFYVAPEFGMINFDNDYNLDNAATAGVMVGYNFTNQFALQGGVNVMNPQGKTTNNGFSAYFARIEGVLNFDTGTHFTPYVAMGVGVLNKDADTSVDSNSHDTIFDPGLGVHYYLGDDSKSSVDLNYRRLVDVSGSTQSNLVTLGLTWMFGSAQGGAVVQPAIPAKKLTTTQKKILTKAKTQLKYVLPNGVVQCNAAKGITAKQGCVTLDGNKLTMHIDVKFVQNKSTIRSEYDLPIHRLATFMKKYPKTSMTFYGYASKEGPRSFNQVLSQERSDAAKRYIVKAGVNPNRVTSIGMGIADPMNAGASASDLSVNRRVVAAVKVPLKAS